jgi:hypothetical protein
VRESRSLGSVRGTASNGRSYREHGHPEVFGGDSHAQNEAQSLGLGCSTHHPDRQKVFRSGHAIAARSAAAV